MPGEGSFIIGVLLTIGVAYLLGVGINAALNSMTWNPTEWGPPKTCDPACVSPKTCNSVSGTCKDPAPAATPAASATATPAASATATPAAATTPEPAVPLQTGGCATACTSGQRCVGTTCVSSPTRYLLINNSNFLHLAELEITLADNSKLTLDQVIPTATPPYNAAWTVDKLFDGNTSGDINLNHGYHSLGKPAFIRVELKTPATVSKVVIYNRTDCCSERLGSAMLKLLGVNSDGMGTDVIYSTRLTVDAVQTYTPVY